MTTYPNVGLKKTPGAQYVMSAEFIFDMSKPDHMVNTSGVDVSFAAASGTVFAIMTLPGGSIVLGGAVDVQVASDDSGTATIIVGDFDDDDRYLEGPVSIKTLGATSFEGAGEPVLVGAAIIDGTTLPSSKNVQMTLVNGGGDATVGKVKVVLYFVTEGRVHENLKTT